MKTKTITLALVAAFAGFAATAKADHTRVNVGIGFNYGPAYAAPAPVYVPAPVVAPRVEYRYDDHRDRGHWETVSTKVWVPARWVNSRDRWGRPVRILENGYFTFRTDRVWVDHGNHGYGYRG